MRFNNGETVHRSNTPIANLSVRVVAGPDTAARLGESSLGKLLTKLLVESGIEAKQQNEAANYTGGERTIYANGVLHEGHMPGLQRLSGELELGEVRPSGYHIHGTELGMLRFEHGILSEYDVEQIESYAADRREPQLPERRWYAKLFKRNRVRPD